MSGRRFRSPPVYRCSTQSSWHNIVSRTFYIIYVGAHLLTRYTVYTGVLREVGDAFGSPLPTYRELYAHLPFFKSYLYCIVTAAYLVRAASRASFDRRKYLYKVRDEKIKSIKFRDLNCFFYSFCYLDYLFVS